MRHRHLVSVQSVILRAPRINYMSLRRVWDWKNNTNRRWYHETDCRILHNSLRWDKWLHLNSKYISSPSSRKHWKFVAQNSLHAADGIIRYKGTPVISLTCNMDTTTPWHCTSLTPCLTSNCTCFHFPGKENSMRKCMTFNKAKSREKMKKVDKDNTEIFNWFLRKTWKISRLYQIQFHLYTQTNVMLVHEVQCMN